MAFASAEDVIQRVEQLMKSLWTQFSSPETVISEPLPPDPFPRITYDQAMSYFGSDKPDLRIKAPVSMFLFKGIATHAVLDSSHRTYYPF
jgi:aspartyl-tRNA synthetase